MAEVAEIVTKVQAGEAPTAEEYATVQAAVENPAVPVNVRVRALPVLAAHVEVNQALLPKVVGAFVKMLEDDLAVVHTAVVKALTDLCVAAAKFLEANKMLEVVRDTADALFQISLPSSGFAPEVRKAAKDAVTATLPGVCIVGVAVKAAHLLSNDRWNDEPEQLELERKAALDLLAALITPKTKELWNEESESKLLKFIGVLFTTCTAGEVGRLLSALGNLPGVAEKEGAPLVDLVLKMKMDGPRGLETFTKLSRCMPKAAVNDALIDKAATLLGKAKAGEAVATQIAKVFDFAAHHASAEKAAKHIATVRAALGKSSNESWTFTEAMLRAFGTLAAKAPEAAAEALESDEFRQSVFALAETASKLELKLEFATAKAALTKEATPKHAEAIVCLKNVIRMGAFVEAKKAPDATGQPSWAARVQLPRAPNQKRVNLDAPLAQGKKPQPKPANK